MLQLLRRPFGLMRRRPVASAVVLLLALGVLAVGGAQVCAARLPGSRPRPGRRPARRRFRPNRLLPGRLALERGCAFPGGADRPAERRLPGSGAAARRVPALAGSDRPDPAGGPHAAGRARRGGQGRRRSALRGQPGQGQRAGHPGGAGPRQHAADALRPCPGAPGQLPESVPGRRPRPGLARLGAGAAGAAGEGGRGLQAGAGAVARPRRGADAPGGAVPGPQRPRPGGAASVEAGEDRPEPAGSAAGDGALPLPARPAGRGPRPAGSGAGRQAGGADGPAVPRQAGNADGPAEAGGGRGVLPPRPQSRSQRRGDAQLRCTTVCAPSPAGRPRPRRS